MNVLEVHVRQMLAPACIRREYSAVFKSLKKNCTSLRFPRHRTALLQGTYSAFVSQPLANDVWEMQLCELRFFPSCLLCFALPKYLA